MNYIVYAHTNKINGKKYIGITSRKPNVRFGNNGRNYHDSPKFWNAIQAYGWDNFTHEILEYDLNQSEARRKEIKYIKKYNSIENGYNISEGGDMPPRLCGNKNHNYGGISDGTKLKMSINHADFSLEKHPRARKIMCVETEEIFHCITKAAIEKNISRKCISDCCTGRQNTAAGYNWKYID